MVYLMRVKLRSGRTKVFCAKLTPDKQRVWTAAKGKLNLNPLVKSCSVIPL
jgi:hypothetical protein